jgi:hypothetical protein
VNMQLNLPLELVETVYSSESWEEQFTTMLKIAHFIAQQPLLKHYKTNMLDRTIRGASDILSCETTRVHNNTQSMIQWCLLWTEDAQRLYWEHKQSTHPKTVAMRNANKKRYWSVEHPHPIIEVKQLLLDGCSFNELKDWMYEYGRAVIVSQAELAALPQLGKDRYEQLGIRFGRFDPATLTRPR